MTEFESITDYHRTREKSKNSSNLGEIRRWLLSQPESKRPARDIPRAMLHYAQNDRGAFFGKSHCYVTFVD